MKITPQDRQLIESYLSGVRDGKPSIELAQRLAERVKESNDFAWLYVQLAHLESSLWWNYSIRAGEVGFERDLAIGEQQFSGKDTESALSLRANSSVPAQHPALPSSRLAAVGKLTAPAWTALAGLCVSAAVIAAMVLLLREPSKVHETTKTTVASNVGSSDATGIGHEPGAVKFKVENVGWVIAEQGADFQLLGPMRARITKGLIKMRVTEKSGHGFVVETPYGQVTDLGTEFGLDLTTQKQAGLVVFEGAVDLSVAHAKTPNQNVVQRLTGGEGVEFTLDGSCSRINTVFTGNGPTFQRRALSEAGSGSDARANEQIPLIIDVVDNLDGSKKFYEVVPGGMREDARCYGDRAHEWNGAQAQGMPAYLVGADYVKTFNQDHVVLDQKIQVTLSQPVRLFVFLDARLEAPEWLREDFHNTGDRLGQDAAPNGMKQFRNRKIEVGPGNSIDEQFTIWERDVLEPAVVTLGSNVDPSDVKTDRGMYGIAAVALDAAKASRLQP